MEEKSRNQIEVERKYPLTKGLAIFIGSFLTIVVSIFFPVGEFLLYGFFYLVGKEENKHSSTGI
ncbi:MAG: hypothetical protein ABIN24_04240 [Dyadobacter sp.]